MIIFMGVAGSGKSIQGRLLADQLALPWLSTGEFLRMLIAGDKRRDMLAGKLLENQEIINLVQRIFGLIDVSKEFVLDGFPRTVEQADWLLGQAKHGQLKITAVVHLNASEEVIMERLLARGRQDDYAEALHERIREFEETIKPILDSFRSDGIPVHDIDGEQTVEEVHASIIRALESDK